MIRSHWWPLHGGNHRCSIVYLTNIKTTKKFGFVWTNTALSFIPCLQSQISLVLSLSSPAHQKGLMLKYSCCGSSILDHNCQNIQNQSGWWAELGCEAISRATRKLENIQPDFSAKTMWQIFTQGYSMRKAKSLFYPKKHPVCRQPLKKNIRMYVHTHTPIQRDR